MPAARPVRRLRPRGRKFVTVLALDGGGIRGIIPARVLASLERRMGMPASRAFDLVAGTSTGGILALALTKPAAGGVSPRYAAKDLVDLYRTRGPEIFRRSPVHFLTSLGGLAGPKYPGGAIERVLLEYFGTARIAEALAPVLVTSYDTVAAKPYFFKSYRDASGATAAQAAVPDDYLMWQAARATSAAPTYFPPFRLGPPPGTSGADKCLLDGGVFANNPAMCALADAYKMFGPDSRYLVVSVGTGNDDVRLSYAQLRSRGLLGWAIPILKVAFDGVADTVDYQAEEMAHAYYRFQHDGTEEELDDASPRTIQRLLADADDLVAKSDALLEKLAKELRENVQAPTSPTEGPVATAGA